MPWLPRRCAALTLVFLALTGAAAQAAVPVELSELLAARLPLFGHRNWIVIADSAYPAQAHPSIETVYIGGEQLTAVRTLLDALAGTRHVRPVVYLDQELSAVSERDAPGMDDYRRQLATLLGKQPPRRVPHEALIGQLDASAETFRILIVKTDGTLPYTSVFVQLDCGYWSDAAEQRLRASLSADEQ